MDKNFNRYKLKVSLYYNKRIYRVIQICGSDTLDDLSDIIISSFDLSADHLYLFNMDNVKYSENCYSRIQENGDKSTDFLLDNLHLVEKQKILYLYDFGDEWEFQIQVQKIDCQKDYNKPLVLEAAGEIEQYLDYEEVILIQFSDNLKLIDILNEIGDEYIQQEYLSLFDYQKPVDGKDPEKLRHEIMEEVLNYPEHLTFFLPSKQLRYLEALINEENIFSSQDRYELMKLYSFGFCQINEDEYGFSIEVPRQVLSVYKSYFADTKNRKTMNKNEEFQKIAEYLLSKFGVIELEELFKMLLCLTKQNMEYADFKYFAYSRLYYLGHYTIFEGAKQVLYISLFHQEDALQVLEQRNSTEEYRKLSYPVFSLQHCRKAIKQNYYLEYPDYKKWWEYLNLDSRLDSNVCNQLLAVTTYAALIQEDEKKLMKECRELFHQGGCNFTKKAQKLIQALLNGLPNAAKKGRTSDEYEKQVTKKNKVDVKDRDEKEVYEQLSLF